ncbi:hypothetical protein BCR39DRAFT_569301 [Naematelia encephala]|uniref:Uncharacterized protein n=1 Tax=Naematelia encephala TaxID=71784 RepID=A0A1Y2AHI7_9TREE|nr:hypothetical protein BCR39DRAFT_569301 [Naematelia encephala]
MAKSGLMHNAIKCMLCLLLCSFHWVVILQYKYQLKGVVTNLSLQGLGAWKDLLQAEVNEDSDDSIYYNKLSSAAEFSVTPIRRLRSMQGIGDRGDQYGRRNDSDQGEMPLLLAIVNGNKSNGWLFGSGPGRVMTKKISVCNRSNECSWRLSGWVFTLGILSRGLSGTCRNTGGLDQQWTE